MSSSTLFAPPAISINFKNFYNNVSGEDVSLELGGPIPTTGIDTIYDGENSYINKMHDTLLFVKLIIKSLFW